MLSDALGESGVPALDLSANLVEVGDSVKNSLDKRLASIGVQLGDFRFESVSLPPELEKALDENAGSMMGAGLGMGMGMHMANAFGTQPKKEARGGGAFCPACGAAVSPNAKFCPECGKSLLRACPACGAALSANAKFCPECGQKL